MAFGTPSDAWASQLPGYSNDRTLIAFRQFVTCDTQASWTLGSGTELASGRGVLHAVGCMSEQWRGVLDDRLSSNIWSRQTDSGFAHLVFLLLFFDTIAAAASV